jgi:hypothetical protein
MSVLLAAADRRYTGRRIANTDCQIVRERDFRLVARTVVDLSLDGLLALAEERVLTGEPLIIAFRAPRTSTWIETEAVVARVSHGRRPGDRGTTLGISFEDLPPLARALLGVTLMGLPFPKPTRKRRIERLRMVRRAPS